MILDACAMIAYLRGEEGSEAVAQYLIQEPSTCQAHAVNLCEVYYDFLKAAGEVVAKAAINDLLSVGLIVREDMDIVFWQSVGYFKVDCKVSLGDAFAIALAKREKSAVLTSDHKEFEPVSRSGKCSVTFFR